MNRLSKNFVSRSYYKTYKEKNYPRLMIRRCKNRASTHHLEFNITVEDILPLPTHCPILGIKLEVHDDIACANSYSLDRIDPSKGYIKGNVAVMSKRANLLKNNASIEELEKILEFLKKQNAT